MPVSNNPKDTNVTITVRTDSITEANKNTSVVFSDDVGDPAETPGDPRDYVSTVWKNKKITWTSLARNDGNVVTISGVAKDGGSEIMDDLTTGDNDNVYQAKIKNDPKISPGTQESYSITLNVYGIMGLAGENTAGAIVYNGTQVAYMNSYANNNWNRVANAPIAIQGLAGENSHGAIIFNGSQVYYMNSYAENVWHPVANAPVQIQGIAGDNANGPVIYSGNQVYYMNSYAENVWHRVTNAPCQAEGIAGNNANGPVVYNGAQVFYMNSYAEDAWHQVSLAPFPIGGIAGNNAHGPIVFFGDRLAYMNSYAENLWHQTNQVSLNPTTFIIDPKIQMH